MVIAVDFDGTCVTHEFPKVGKDIGAVPVLKKLVEKGHEIILCTIRCHNSKKCVTDEGVKLVDTLQEAIDWFERNNIPLYGVNENPDQRDWTSSPKIYAHLYIDDAALGVPLKFDGNISDRAFVDWEEVEQFLITNGVIW